MMSPDDAQTEPPMIGLLDRMRAILVNATEGGASAREHAVAYLDVRSKLLSSDIGDLLPGFLYQCRTVMKFNDFITLYDPDIDLRIAFIDRMIDRCRQIVKPTGTGRSPESQAGRKILKS